VLGVLKRSIKDPVNREISYYTFEYKRLITKEIYDEIKIDAQ